MTVITQVPIQSKRGTVVQDFVVEITRMKTVEERAILQVTASSKGDAWRDAQRHVSNENNAVQLAWFLGDEYNGEPCVINVIEQGKEPRITKANEPMER